MFPDQLTQLNVSDVKKSFEVEAISHQLQWMANRLKCKRGFFNSAIEKHDGTDGLSGEILQEKLLLMRSRIAAIPDDNPQLKNRMENEIDFIEISVIIHRIFMQRFLNKNARLVLTPETRKRDSLKRRCILSLNADEEFETMKELTKQLDNWIE